jgi:hypothetical protein
VPGGDKERVCQSCEHDTRASHIEEIEEAVDVRMQINSTLRALLKERYEEIEALKKDLIGLVNTETLLREPPSLDGPWRFDAELGAGRISFSDLVKYIDDTVQKLSVQRDELRIRLETESSHYSERSTNFRHLQHRTALAEEEVDRVKGLAQQKARLRETFLQQEATLRALQDRVAMMERRGVHRTAPLEGEGLVDAFHRPFIGDILVDSVFPCIRLT